MSAKTKNYVRSPWAVCTCWIVNFAMQCGLLGLMLAWRFELKYWVFAACAALLTAVFMLLSFFTNFRFRYGLSVILGYLLPYIVQAGVELFVLLHAQQAITNKLLICRIVAHACGILCTIVTYVFSAVNGKNIKLWHTAAVVLTLVMLSSSLVVYALTIRSDGYLGQGREGEVRPINYVYDSATDSYFAVGTVQTGGDTVVITDTFNGKPVTKLSGELFAAHGIETVRFTGFEQSKFTLTDTESLDALGKLKMESTKANINNIKECMYATAKQKVFDLANLLVPTDLNEDEVYITFAYDTMGYERFGGKVIPTWVGKRGDTFHTDFFDDYEFMKRRDITSQNDLLWNYVNTGGYIFAGLNVKGTPLEGNVINQSYDGVSISFDKIFRVFVLDGNDTKFQLPNSVTGFENAGTRVDNRFVVNSLADNLLDEVVPRHGFDIVWNYTPAVSTNVNALESRLVDGKLSKTLEQLSDSGEDTITIAPIWTMRAPTLATLTFSAEDDKIRYGDEVTLNMVATAADESFELSYSWSGPYCVPKDNAPSVVIDSMPFDGGGKYSCTVTSSSEFSSLTANDTESMEITVDRRQITLLWNLSQLNQGSDGLYYYNGEDQFVTIAFGEGDCINDDVFDWQIENSGDCSKKDSKIVFENIFSESIVLCLTGIAAHKYEIKSGESHTINILPAKVSAEWSGETTYSYNGEEQAPDATVAGLGKDGDLHTERVITNGKGVAQPINADSYTATITLSSNATNRNYEIVNGAERKFEIKPVTINVIWNELDSFVYSSATQHPVLDSVTAVQSTDNKVVEKERAALLANGIEYVATIEGAPVPAVNANRYLVKATLKDLVDVPYSTNYVVEDEGKEFEITPRVISPTWNKLDGVGEFVFNGLPQAPQVMVLNDVVANESDELIASLNATRQFDDHVNVNSYSVTVELQNSNYVWKNEEETTCHYSIVRKSVSVDWAQPIYNPIYNGEAQVPTALSNGLCGNDVFTVTVTAINGQLTDGKSVNVGRYKATASCTDNYDLSNADKEFEIIKRQITLEWASASLTYNAEEQAPNVVDILNAIEEEKEVLLAHVNEVRSYSGNVNVGSHIVSVTLLNSDMLFATNYSVNNDEFNYTIDEAPLRAKWIIAESYTYSHEEQFVEVELEGAVKDEHPEWTITYNGSESAPVNAGVYALQVSLKDDPVSKNYIIVHGQSTSFTILAKDVTAVWSQQDFVYNGTAQSPQVLGFEGDFEGDKIPLSSTQLGGAETNAGSNYVATVSLSGLFGTNYHVINAECTYAIEQAPITLSWRRQAFTYNGERQYPTVDGVSGAVASEESILLNYGIDYTLKEDNDNGVDAGNHTAEANLRTAMGIPFDINYKIVDGKTQEYTIDKLEVTLTWTDTQFTYDGAQHRPTPKANGADGHPLVFSFTVSIRSGSDVGAYATNAGDYTVTVQIADVSLRSNYDLNEKSCDFGILPKSIDVVWADALSYTYCGEHITPTAEISGAVEGDEPRLIVGYTSAGISTLSTVDVGEYTATVTLAKGDVNNNYTLNSQTVSKSYVIEQRSLTLVWGADTFVYNGKLQHPQIVKVLNAVKDEVSVEDFVCESFKDVGAHTFNVTFAKGDRQTKLVRNYALSNAQKSFTITAQPLLVEWGGALFTYNCQEQFLNVQLVGAVESEQPTFELTYLYKKLPNLNAEPIEQIFKGGSYTATIALTQDDVNKNYVLDQSAQIQFSFEVERVALTAVWDVDPDAEYVYNGTPQGPSVIRLDGVLEGDTVELSAIFYDGKTHKDVGRHDVRIWVGTLQEESDNYKIQNDSFTFFITPVPVKVSWSNTELDYTGSAQCPTPSAKGIEADGTPELALITKVEQIATPLVGDVAVNAGNYRCVTQLVENEINKNYSLTNAEVTFIIKSPSLTATERVSTTLIHDGFGFAPVVTDFSDMLESDKSRIISALEY